MSPSEPDRHGSGAPAGSALAGAPAGAVPIGARRGRALWWLPLAVLAIGLITAFAPFAARLSQPLLDAQQRWLAPDAPAAGLLVVDIDDASLAALAPQLGSWPFRRDVYALVIEQLRELGARAIVIDLLLTDVHEGDAALARAIGRAGAPVVLAAAGLRHAIGNGPRPAARDAADGTAAAGALSWPALALPAESLWPAPGHPPPLGLVSVPLDADGTLRRLPLWHEVQGRRWPSLPLAVWQAVDGRTPPPPWPLDDRGYAHLTFGGAEAAPPTLSFARLAQAALDPAEAGALAPLVRARVVFVGSSALAADSVLTVAGQMAATPVLAQVYAALRDDTLLRAAPRWALALPLAAALLPALAIAWRGRPRVARDGALVAIAALAVLALGLGLLHAARMPALTLAPAAMLAATLWLSLWCHERSLQRQARHLEHAREVAAATSRTKSEFLANVSHEMRTPMNALLGVADLLADTPLDTEQRRHVQVLRQSGQTLLQLIDHLLDLAKIEAGRFELQPAPFALRQTLQDIMSMLGPRARQKGLAFELQVADDVPEGLLADRHRLGQAVTNLLANAIKFTASGGVTLDVRREGDEQLRLEVRDSGIGIAPSRHEQIFEPFSQADGTITRVYGGTGLGLAITRRIAGLMGGRVDVDSAPGEGSRFSLVVPLVAAALPAAPQHAAEIPAPRTAARVLLAEDNDVNVYVFQAMLDGEPTRVDVAVNGPTALAMAQERVYDIIFMDVQMPGMDGLTVTRRLRAFEAVQARPRTPVVALTANAFEEDVRASREAGCDRHLRKPFSKRELLATIAELATAPAASAAVLPGAAPGAPHAAEAAAAAQAAAAATPVLDEQEAIARLGGDLGRHQRVREHAAVFVARWADDFEQARREGRAEQMQALVHDLHEIASRIGAHPLARAAARLEQSLREAPGGAPDASAYAAVRDAAVPVIAALGRPD